MKNIGWAVLIFGIGVAVGCWIASRDAVAPNSKTSTLDVIEARPKAFAAASGMPAAPARPTGASAPNVSPPVAADARVPEDDDTGIVQPIDAGPFAKEMAAHEAREKASGSNEHDPLSSRHRALEHEMRDESWAGPLEAEIENSLYADASVGNFRTEHVECRSTMCEIRLSAADANAGAAMSKWGEGLSSQPWGTRLYPSVTSTINDGKRFDQILILIRPPAATKRN